MEWCNGMNESAYTDAFYLDDDNKIEISTPLMHEIDEFDDFLLFADFSSVQ